MKLKINDQEPTAVEKSLPEDGKIAVKEIFYSIQGEGPYSGRPAIFVRLGGCNIQCKFCDTDYSDGDRLSCEEIIEQALTFCGGLKVNHPLVVITGGEPFRQYVLPELCEKLVRDQFQVQIETNGTCFQKGFSKGLEGFVSVVCSPKAEHLHKELEPHISCLKLLVKNVHGTPYVCFHNTDRPLIVALNKWGGDFPIYLQPLENEDVQKNTDIVVEACLHFNLPISLQLHKILNLR